VSTDFSRAFLSSNHYFVSFYFSLLQQALFRHMPNKIFATTQAYINKALQPHLLPPLVSSKRSHKPPRITPILASYNVSQNYALYPPLRTQHGKMPILRYHLRNRSSMYRAPARTIMPTAQNTTENNPPREHTHFIEGGDKRSHTSKFCAGRVQVRKMSMGVRHNKVIKSA